MKQVEAPFLGHLHKTSSTRQISVSLDNILKHPIDIAPWPEFNYAPGVHFSIAHDNERIFIKYYVTEAVVKAAYYKPNDPVYKDSCVEFFIAFNDEQEYYNLEFNMIGTCKLNFGINRNHRIIVSENLTRTIRYFTSLQSHEGNEATPGVHWELTLTIPIEVFCLHKLTSLSKKICSANFYKCGDDLPVPHFLCWNNIQSITPDFHTRQFFGKILFL